MRQAEVIGHFAIAFVVQAINFREMPAFVRLGQSLRVDRVGFQIMRHWIRGMSEEAFAAAQVWRPGHPLYAEFRSVLEQPELRAPIVDLGDATPPSTEEQIGRDAPLPKLRRIATTLGRRMADAFDAK